MSLIQVNLVTTPNKSDVYHLLGMYIIYSELPNHYDTWKILKTAKMEAVIGTELSSAIDSLRSITGLDNGLLPVWCEAIICTHAGLIIDNQAIWEDVSVDFESKYNNFYSRKCIWKSCLQPGSHFSQPQSFKASLCCKSTKLASLTFPSFTVVFTTFPPCLTLVSRYWHNTVKCCYNTV